ncbi:MAG TPA: STAS domain-containing protein [Thermoleophilaceae bacterium]
MQEFQLLLSEPGGGVLELTLIGEVDLATVQTLRDATETAVASGDYSCLVFNLEQLGFIDSSGLHALADAHQAMKATGGTATVICGPGNIRKLLELTGLDRLFPIVTTRDEAVAA